MQVCLAPKFVIIRQNPTKTQLKRFVADSPLGNLDDEPPSSEENIQCFGTDWVVDKKDLGIVLVTKVSVVYVLAWS